MNICLEGPRGQWDWFEADLREPDLGLNREQVKAVCGSSNPQVIDIEYDNNEPYEGLLQFDGMGWTSMDALIKEAEELTQFEDDELEQIAAYMNTKSGDLQYAIDHFKNHYYWKTDNSNIEDFAREYLEETGYDADFLAQYFDYAALGEELLSDPDYEPLSDNGNEWDEGELYIDQLYGSVEDFIANHDLDTVFDYYFDLDGFANGNLRYSFDYDDQTGIWVSESVRTKSNKKTIKENYYDNRFKVTSYYDNNYRGVGSSEDFDSYDEAEEYAHDRLINGENIIITDTETGNRVMINSREYTMKFDGDFVVNTDIYDFKQSVLRSYESVNRKSGKSKLKESIDLTQVFEDPQGMFGEPGGIVTAQELKDYWDEEYEWDPTLQDFNSFEDWYEDTIEWFVPID